ncbi:MAG TPA: hypothetical protein VFJ24_10435 [Gaiellales bacterium]|nr:hypothetical protein [Gaiellales bacterium]
MADEKNSAAPRQPDAATDRAASPARRRLLQAGLIAATVPVVVTIKGRPAWAKCDLQNLAKCTSKDLRKLSASLYPSRATKK